MKLRPFANLFALRHPDPQLRDKVAAALVASGRFSEVWRPAPSWICAAAPLRDGEPDSAETRALGLAFAEGRDTLTGDFTAQPRERLARVAELARTAPERLAELPGDFGFLHFSPDDSALAVRSCAGWVPFYEHSDGTTVAFGTRLDDFARFLPTEPKLDPLVVAVWAGKPCFPDRRTFLAGVKLVPQGCTRQVTTAGAVEATRYWNPEKHAGERHSPAEEREHAERLRALLLRALERDLLPDGGNLLWLSGGVDSSAMGALAAGAAKKPVWTWSLLPEREDLYQEELAYIVPLAHQYAFAHRWEVRFGRDTWNNLLRNAPPTLFPQHHPGMGDLPRVLREAPVRVVFGGEFADEVCGSYCTVPDWVERTPLSTVLAQIGSGVCPAKDFGRWLKHRWLAAKQRPMLPFATELPEFIHPDVRAEYAEWFDRRRRAAGGEPSAWRYLTLRLECDNFATMNWEGTSALNLRRSFPFLQREVIELAYACHPAELIRPGHKLLLRRALELDLPAHNLNRADKGAWGRFNVPSHYSLGQKLPDSVAPMVRKDWFPQPPDELSYYEASRMEQFTLTASNYSSCLAARPTVQSAQ